ncbi:photosystem II protein psb30 (chloroplast) [Galdieria partita]|uniref:Photosystem II reaction center protein Psb30 n=1 Tax=Galdieria partita TaxID=83374 RepID=A0A9C7F5H1_9RHOD|nr:photosystem II protein psb30 [Galdieria partita]
MINWQVIGQLIALTLIIVSGPAIIMLLSFRKGNL